MARKDEERDDELNEDEESTGGDASAEERDDDERSEDESADEESEESAAAHARERAEQEEANLATEAKALAHESTETAAEQLGSSARYVHAAFFVAGILIAFVSSKIIGVAWGALADWPAATRAVPLLLRFAEDERGSYALGIGAFLGILTVVQVYRKEHARTWANEVALELTKVSWPSRETVTNGTVVVIVASMIATVYVALLDRFWGFLTHLVYGA